MALFFFVVGLEVELVHGELRQPLWRPPAIAALGGMVVPALLFLLVTIGGGGSKGWGIPMATDIAFAVGVVALLGTRVPSSLKLFLTTFAIVDDIGGAIVVIAVFYATDVQPVLLAAAFGLVAAMVGLRRAGVVWLAPYVVLGVGICWRHRRRGACHHRRRRPRAAGPGPAAHAGGSGPTVGRGPERRARPRRAQRHDPAGPERGASLLERLEHGLHPWTSFVVVPLLPGQRRRRDQGRFLRCPRHRGGGRGVVLGLVVGKLVGITAATWLAVLSAGWAACLRGRDAAQDGRRHRRHRWHRLHRLAVHRRACLPARRCPGCGQARRIGRIPGRLLSSVWQCSSVPAGHPKGTERRSWAVGCEPRPSSMPTLLLHLQSRGRRCRRCGEELAPEGSVNALSDPRPSDTCRRARSGDPPADVVCKCSLRESGGHALILLCPAAVAGSPTCTSAPRTTPSTHARIAGWPQPDRPAMLARSAAEVTYGLDRWPVVDRAALTEALAADGIPYRWEVGLVLAVPEAAEGVVDDIRVDFERAAAGDDIGVGTADGGEDAGDAAMSNCSSSPTASTTPPGRRPGEDARSRGRRRGRRSSALRRRGVDVAADARSGCRGRRDHETRTSPWRPPPLSVISSARMCRRRRGGAADGLGRGCVQGSERPVPAVGPLPGRWTGTDIQAA